MIVYYETQKSINISWWIRGYPTWVAKLTILWLWYVVVGIDWKCLHFGFLSTRILPLDLLFWRVSWGRTLVVTSVLEFAAVVLLFGIFMDGSSGSFLGWGCRAILWGGRSWNLFGFDRVLKVLLFSIDVVIFICIWVVLGIFYRRSWWEFIWCWWINWSSFILLSMCCSIHSTLLRIRQ